MNSELDQENFGNVDPAEYARRTVARADRGGRSQMKTLLEKRSQAWDWMNIETPAGSKAVVFVRDVSPNTLTLGVESEDEVDVTHVDGGFTQERTLKPPMKVYEIVLQSHPNGGWDWAEIAFPGEDDRIDVIIGRAWYQKVALTIQAPRSVKLRKTKAVG